MKPILYFLRSTEQKIATGMLHYAKRLDAYNKTLADFPQLCIYEKHYGLTQKDLGLYALLEHEIAGAAWIRLLREEDGANAYVDEKTPVLIIGIKPEFRAQGIGSAMLEQLLLEAGALYEQISVSVVKDSPAIKFYERFGFSITQGSVKKSIVDDSDVVTLTKKLIQQEVKRPSDGYDPKKWMD
ncbi:GNAT family N-acetyltransferase [bacterium]|nr:GNAT family N-acetyltransferase [bacterium]MBU1994900.1 GNAT family N-acetyltransferase [bacterium]